MTYHFLTPHLCQMLEDGHEVYLASTDLEGYDELLKSKIQNLDISLQYVRLNRSPFKISNYKGISDLKKIVDSENFDLIWTNEPVMSIATRIASKRARKNGTKVLYMVHGFHFFKGSSKLSWLIYYPIERIMAHYADYLVTINKEDFLRGKKFAFRKVFYIHGVGLDTSKFRNIIVDKKQIRKEIGVPEDAIMLLSVGELGTRKNHEVVIRALGKIRNKNIHYVICGEGILGEYLSRLCKELHIDREVHFLGYRKDIAELCKTADIYIFPSQREGLGIGALEGMASGLPLISSYVNGIRDYTEEGKTGITLEPHDVAGFKNAIEALVSDKKLREKYGHYNAEYSKAYDVENSKKEIQNIIREILNIA